MSLRLRLTLFYTLFLAVVLAAVATAVYAYTQRSLVRALEERAEQTLIQLSQNGYDNVEAIQALPNDADYVLRRHAIVPRTWEDLQEGTTFRYSLGLKTLYISSRDGLFQTLSDDNLKTLFDTGEVSTWLRTDSEQYIYYAVTDSLVQGAGPISNFVVAQVAFPFPSDTLSGLQSLLLRTMSIAFLVFALGVWLLSYRVLLPVKRVTEAAAKVSGRDLSQRVPVPKTEDEMKDLATSLNSMLDRLQESFETQRRFTADASHELRTPVTAIVGHVNYLLRRTKPTEDQQDSLTIIRSEGERMAKLVNDLLELARADAGLSITREPMNIVEVIEAVHMEIAPVARETKIHVSSSDPLIEVSGDASRLKQVVLNLVQNAMNAGAKNITLSLQQEKKNVRLEVLDDGPGIPEEAIPHLFDRFFRVDGARSTRGNGSGLGLAIVRWIVQQHEGSVSVESKVGEGTVFTVLLPSLSSQTMDLGRRGKAATTQERPKPKAVA